MCKIKKDEFIRYCNCMEDVVKLKVCYECPHYNVNTVSIDNACKYSSNIENN